MAQIPKSVSYTLLAVLHLFLLKLVTHRKMSTLIKNTHIQQSRNVKDSLSSWRFKRH